MHYSVQRELILNIVKNTKSHPTAEWVYKQAQKEIPKIGVATVYRNLRALAEMNECKRIVVAGGQDRFDGDTSKHFHLECKCCGELRDLKSLDEEKARRLRGFVEETFQIEGENLELSEVLLKWKCDNCRGLKKKSN